MQSDEIIEKKLLALKGRNRNKSNHQRNDSILDLFIQSHSDKALWTGCLLLYWMRMRMRYCFFAFLFDLICVIQKKKSIPFFINKSLAKKATTVGTRQTAKNTTIDKSRNLSFVRNRSHFYLHYSAFFKDFSIVFNIAKNIILLK
jgi:hypothetical protein